MKVKRSHAVFVLALLALCAMGYVSRTRLLRTARSATHVASGKKTVADRLSQYGDIVRARLRPYFDAAGLAYPPQAVTLVGLKEEKILEVWAAHGGIWRHVHDYPIRRASGTVGPKLREGDGQVPEGVYRVESLNPNSAFHLALRVGYPNDFDKAKAQSDGRTQLGGDIMIHGGAASIGCLAMGDEAAEDLFVLAADTGIHNITVVLDPVDFRKRALPPGLRNLPAWTPELYASIKAALESLGK